MEQILAETSQFTQYRGGLGYLYLDGKLLELLSIYLGEVLELDILMGKNVSMSRTERTAIMEAKRIIDSQLAFAPSCEELSHLVHLSTTKLTRGFSSFYQLFASSVEEELSLGMQEDCKEKIDTVLNALELSDYRERHPASLSGGQKQRVTIGVAIVKDSPAIYFDEPTSGLDYDSMVRVSKLIEQLSDSGVIVFVVSHDFEFIVRTCTEVVQLDDDGTIQNQQLSPTVLKSLSEKYFT